MSYRGRPASVWKHYTAVFKDLEDGTSVKSGFKCNNCETVVAVASKEGYRHCSATDIEEKERAILSLPSGETSIYEQYWRPGQYRTTISFAFGQKETLRQPKIRKCSQGPNGFFPFSKGLSFGS